MKRNLRRLFRPAIAIFLTAGMLVSSTGCALQDVVNSVRDTVVDSGKKKEEVKANNLTSLLDSIKPNTKIVLKEADYDFESELSKLFGSDGNDFNKAHKYVKLENNHGSIQILIENVTNLEIVGREDSSVVLKSESPNADVFRFVDCQNISISDMEICHSRGYNSGTGDVLSFKNCSDIKIDNVSLYGADGYAIDALKVEGIKVTNTKIDSCKSGAVLIQQCKDIVFDDSSLSGGGGEWLIEAKESTIDFNQCSFWGCRYTSDFCSKSDKNDIHFNGCDFGEDESLDLSYGAVTGDEGYAFDNECVFIQVLDGDGSVAPSSREEVDVYTVEEFFDAIGTNKYIRLHGEEYDFNEYFSRIRNLDQWLEEHTEYISVNTDSKYGGSRKEFDIVIRECNNLFIEGERTDSYCTKIINDTEEFNIINFFNCNSISLANLVFEDSGVNDKISDLIMFYNCSNVDFYTVNLMNADRFGLYATTCSGNWYFYNCEMANCNLAPAQFIESSCSVFYNGCTFTGKDGFIEPHLDDLTDYSFVGCNFDTAILASVSIFFRDTDFVFKDNNFGEMPEMNGLEDIENLSLYYISDETICQEWTGIEYLHDGEYVPIPFYDKFGYKVNFHIELRENHTGTVKFGSYGYEDIEFYWGKFDTDNFTHFYMVWNSWYGEAGVGEIWSFASEDNYYRVQTRIGEDYYLAW